MKKYLAILLALAMIFALAACGESGAKPAVSGDLVGVAMPTKDLQRWNQDGDYMKAGLEKAIDEIAELRKEFHENVLIPNHGGVNTELEKALRVSDFLELGELIARDALQREESCGGHFRIEHQTPDGEAQRDDENFKFVAAYEYQENGTATLHKEELEFQDIKLRQRNYK